MQWIGTQRCRQYPSYRGKLHRVKAWHLSLGQGRLGETNSSFNKCHFCSCCDDVSQTVIPHLHSKYQKRSNIKSHPLVGQASVCFSAFSLSLKIEVAFNVWFVLTAMWCFAGWCSLLVNFTMPTTVLQYISPPSTSMLLWLAQNLGVFVHFPLKHTFFPELTTKY